jgi:hypothetical protein
MILFTKTCAGAFLDKLILLPGVDDNTREVNVREDDFYDVKDVIVCVYEVR